jgi:hypothetical protein
MTQSTQELRRFRLTEDWIAVVNINCPRHDDESRFKYAQIRSQDMENTVLHYANFDIVDENGIPHPGWRNGCPIALKELGEEIEIPLA